MSRPPVLKPAFPSSGSGERPAVRVPERKASGIRPIVRPPLEDEWLDRQLLLTANLVHLRARAEAHPGNDSPAWLRLVHRLEALKDALYEVANDALAPPLAPCGALRTFAEQMYAWSDDVLTWGERQLGREAVAETHVTALPVPAVLELLETAQVVLGADHPLLPRVKSHVAEASFRALAVQREMQACAGDK